MDPKETIERPVEYTPCPICRGSVNPKQTSGRHALCVARSARGREIKRIEDHKFDAEPCPCNGPGCQGKT